MEHDRWSREGGHPCPDAVEHLEAVEEQKRKEEHEAFNRLIEISPSAVSQQQPSLSASSAGVCSHHLCDNLATRKCPFCGKRFCDEHIRADVPSMPFRDVEEHRRCSLPGGHGCPGSVVARVDREGEMALKAREREILRECAQEKEEEKMAREMLIRNKQAPQRTLPGGPPFFIKILVCAFIIILLGIFFNYILNQTTSAPNPVTSSPQAEYKIMPQPFQLSFSGSVPANNTCSNQEDLTVAIESSVTLKEARLSYDEKTIQMNLSNGKWRLSLSNLSEGTHEYQVFGMDSKGNWASSEIRTIIIDRTPPKIDFMYESPPDNAQTDKKSFGVGVNLQDPQLASVVYELYNSSGLVYKNASSATAADVSFYLIWDSLPEGVYHYRVIAVDLAGNTAATENRTLTILPPYQTNPSERTRSYVLRGVKKSIEFTVYGGLDDYLAGLPRSYPCDPTCPSEREMQLTQIDEENQKKALVKLVDLIRAENANRDDQARIAISLVQQIPYDQTGFLTLNLTGRYPYEVIFENKGVCGEKSKLLAFLLRELGFGVTLLDYAAEQHMAVGVWCPIRYSLSGSGYCFIETSEPSIPTDANGEYVGVGKLTSTPAIIQVSDGASFDSIAQEYNDAQMFNLINAMAKAQGGILDPTNYYAWSALIAKYGIETAS